MSKEFSAVELPDGRIAFTATLPNRYSLHVMVDAFLSIKPEAGAPPAHVPTPGEILAQVNHAKAEASSVLNVAGPGPNE